MAYPLMKEPQSAVISDNFLIKSRKRKTTHLFTNIKSFPQEIKIRNSFYEQKKICVGDRDYRLN